MHAILWEFKVRGGAEAAFLAAYGPRGDWARFFAAGGAGFRRTDLLADPATPGRYLTIDWWSAASDYDTFAAHERERYRELDARCEGLTIEEKMLGRFEAADRGASREG